MEESYTLQVRAFGHIFLGFGTLFAVLVWFIFFRQDRLPYYEALKKRGYHDRLWWIWGATIGTQTFQCLTTVTYIQLKFENDDTETPLISGIQLFVNVALCTIALLSLYYAIEMFTIFNREMASKWFKIYLPIISVISMICTLVVHFVVSEARGENMAFVFIFLYKWVFFASLIYFFCLLSKHNIHDRINTGPVTSIIVFELLSSIQQIFVAFCAAKQGWMYGLNPVLHYVPLTALFVPSMYEPLIALLDKKSGNDGSNEQELLQVQSIEPTYEANDKHNDIDQTTNEA